MSFDFIDEKNGYLLTYNELSITTNAGNDWIDSDIDIEDYYNLIDVYMVSPKTLYYLVTDKTSKYSTVFKTTDGGNKWKKLYKINDLFASRIYFVNKNVGYIVGYNGIIKTTDEGLTWTYKTQFQKYYVPSIYDRHDDILSKPNICFVSVDTGYIFYNNFIGTTDGGSTWTQIGTPLTKSYGSPICFSVQFLNYNTGFIAGGDLYKTTNHGLNWANTKLKYITSVFFLNDSLGYAASGRVYFYTTTNSGQTWERDSENYFFRKIVFLNKDLGYAVDRNGVVLKTTNGGSKWIEIRDNPNSLRCFRPG